MRSLRKYATESKTISEESVSFDEFCVNDMVFRHSKKCARVDMLIKPSLRKYSIVIAFECNVAFLINNDMIFEVSPSDICIIDDIEQDATSIEDFEALIWFLTSEFERIHIPQ